MINLPEGIHTVVYAADSRKYAAELDILMQVQIEEGKTTTKIVQVPPYHMGYWIYKVWTNGFWAVPFALIHYDHSR